MCLVPLDKSLKLKLVVVDVVVVVVVVLLLKLVVVDVVVVVVVVLLKILPLSDMKIPPLSACHCFVSSEATSHMYTRVHGPHFQGDHLC